MCDTAAADCQENWTHQGDSSLFLLLEVWGPSGPRLLARHPLGPLKSSLATFGRSSHEIHAYIFLNLESSRNSGYFAISGSPVAVYENLKRSKNSGNFTTFGSPVALKNPVFLTPVALFAAKELPYM